MNLENVDAKRKVDMVYLVWLGKERESTSRFVKILGDAAWKSEVGTILMMYTIILKTISMTSGRHLADL